MQTGKRLLFYDFTRAHSWALDYMKDIYERGLLKDIDPLEIIERKKAAVLIEDILASSDEYDRIDIKLIFSDSVSYTHLDVYKRQD